MSTFGGKIEEIPDISVDRFDENNYESYAFFLSHCHTDHMVGLNNGVFQDILLEYKLFIYASEVSCAILKKMYPLIENNVKALDMYKPTLIIIKDKTISVTPLPAGHCPGSVMFLFESDTLILYTGDYRIHKNDIRKCKSFYNSLNQIRPINKIYLDTTFFLKPYLTFPERKDSLNELCKIIKDWIDNGKDYIIHLITSAKYGYEYVFNEIFKNFRMPVHVNREVYQIYSLIPEMDNSVTVNDETQIHANCGSYYQNICFESLGKKIRTIKVSAFRWTQDNLEGGLSSLTSNIYYVCYSTHASYEEGVELIKFLKPKSIEACVEQSDPYDNLEMKKLLDECLSEFRRKEDEINFEPKLFDTSSDCVQDDDLGNDNSDSFDDRLGVLNSPPRKSVDDLRRLLKKHSESFALDTKCGLEIEAECEEIEQKVFNFDDEFAIDRPSTSSAVKEINCVMHETSITENISTAAFCNSKGNEKNQLSSYTVLENLDAFEINSKKQTDILKEASYNLETKVDEFSMELIWLYSPPKTDINIEKEANGETVSDLSKSEFREIKERGSKLDNLNKNLSGSDPLLNEIYFLAESSPPNGELERCIENKEDITKRALNKFEDNNEVASSSWIFRSSPDNVTKSKNLGGMEKNSPPSKKLK